MNKYTLLINTLDKYFALEPWVQSVVLISLTTIIVSLLHFLKGIIVQSIDASIEAVLLIRLLIML